MERIATPKNFGMVAPNLYRSALPNQSQIQYLVGYYQIKTVIDLTERDRRLIVKTCSKAKINYFKFPMIDTEINHDLITQTVNVIESHQNVLIHCWAGKHRTGLISVLVQKRLGFPNSKIFKDLFSFGFGDPVKHKAYFDYILEQLC
jgi:protein tyrosine/serine phosphatase